MSQTPELVDMFDAPYVEMLHFDIGAEYVPPTATRSGRWFLSSPDSWQGKLQLSDDPTERILDDGTPYISAARLRDFVQARMDDVTIRHMYLSGGPVKSRRRDGGYNGKIRAMYRAEFLFVV